MKLIRGKSYSVIDNGDYVALSNRQAHFPYARLYLIETKYGGSNSPYWTKVTVYSDMPPAFCSPGGIAS